MMLVAVYYKGERWGRIFSIRKPGRKETEADTSYRASRAIQGNQDRYKCPKERNKEGLKLERVRGQELGRSEFKWDQWEGNEVKIVLVFTSCLI